MWLTGAMAIALKDTYHLIIPQTIFLREVLIFFQFHMEHKGLNIQDYIPPHPMFPSKVPSMNVNTEVIFLSLKFIMSLNPFIRNVIYYKK